MNRLGVKSRNTQFSGQRRLFFILDRATRKFPGDLGLWMQYLGFARKQGSGKKVEEILTRMLRLHPTKAEMWVYAAKYAMDERGDVSEARGYMQRGLRFCKREERLWVEYLRLELIWVVKVWARRRILGVDGRAKREEEGEETAGEGIEGDVVALPKITAEDVNPKRRDDDGMDQEALEKLEKSPALSGAIPIAIFDAAMKEFRGDEALCLRFFDTVSEFHDAPVTKKILEHIMEVLQTFESPEAFIRFIRQPVMGLRAISPGFPTNLGLCLDRIKMAFKRLEPMITTPTTPRPRGILDGYVVDWMLPYLEEKELDPDVRKVIMMTVRKVWSQFQADTAGYPGGRAAEASKLIGNIRAHGLHKISEPATAWAMDLWPKETGLFSRDMEVRNQ